jgi:hypothetical protein
MALPAKTSIRVDTLLESTLRSLDVAKKDAYPATVVDSIIACLLEGLASTLLSSEQQKHVTSIVVSWKECSNRSAFNAHQGQIEPLPWQAEPSVENVRPILSIAPTSYEAKKGV